jgi:hypothetical protein
MKESDGENRLDSLLERFADSEGKVDYASLQQEEKIVESYVRRMEKLDPGNLRTRNEKLAFWINAYNTLTLYGVLRELRKDPGFAEKGNRSKFQRIRFFWWTKYKISGRKYSLHQIENDILRKKFSEPRIHFALNCGSQSCPLLKDGLYSAENLDEELNIAATIFIRSPRGLLLDKKSRTIHLSSIFKWYEEDFEKASGSVIDFVKRYLSEEDRTFVEDNLSELEVRYQDYDWALNIESS